MSLAMVIAAAEEVGVSMADDAANDAANGVEVEMYKADEEAAEEVTKKVTAHMIMGLTSQRSHVTLKMRSELHYQKRQEKVTIK